MLDTKDNWRCTFYVQVISSSEEAPHIIDGLLYHETDLEIEEHYTDAAGFVDHVFAMCHMLGFRLKRLIKIKSILLKSS
ncbi:TnpA family transposase [Bacillus sp. RC51]